METSGPDFFVRKTFLLFFALGAALAADFPAHPSYTAGGVNLSAGHLDFYIPYSPGTAVTQTLTVTSAGTQPVGLLLTPPRTTNFLVSISQNVTPATITVIAYPSGYGSPVEADSITLTTASGTSIVIPLVSEFWPSPPNTIGWVVSPTSITWNMVAGAAGPSTVFLAYVGAVPGAVYYGLDYYAVDTVSDGDWLRVNGGNTVFTEFPVSGSVSLTFSCVPGQLPPGTYSGTINLLAIPPYEYSTHPAPWSVIPVTLTISPGTPPSLQTATEKLSFDYQIGSTVPGAQTIGVTTSTGGSLGFSVSAAASPVGWLAVSTNSTTTPATATVTVNPAGLSAGQYSGNVTFTPSSGAVVTVPVTLNVHGQPAVSAAPAALAFTWRSGDPKPAAQSIQVNGSATGLGFTAQAASGANWLSVSPASGTAPATLTVAVDPSGLSPGPYSSSITVSGTGGASGQTVVAVTLQVTPPLATITRIGNAASYASDSVAPGEMVTIFGSGLGPKTLAGMVMDGQGNVAKATGGVQVLFNGVAAPVVYASDGQVAAIAPYSLAGKASAVVQVAYGGQTSNGVTLPVVAAVPGIFTANASGTGPGAIANQDYSTNSPANPAAPGSTVVLYLTGEGQTIPGGTDGKITTASAAPPYVPQPVLPVTVTIDGQPATVAFYGEAPAIVSGVMQVNVTIPNGLRSGDLPVIVKVGEFPSQLTSAGVGAVTVSVR